MDQSKIVKKYTNGEVTVVWEPAKCSHSGICARGLSSVFNPKSRPWVNMEGADTQTIINQVNQCPSGALSILSEEDKSESIVSPNTHVQLMPNGPLMIEGDIKLTQGEGNVLLKNKKTAFCRCGASANKPFCDGAHRAANFQG